MKRQEGLKKGSGALNRKPSATGAARAAAQSVPSQGSRLSPGVWKDAKGVYQSKNGYRSDSGYKPAGNEFKGTAAYAAAQANPLSGIKPAGNPTPGNWSNNVGSTMPQQPGARTATEIANAAANGIQGQTPAQPFQHQPGAGRTLTGEQMMSGMNGGSRLGAFANAAQSPTGWGNPQGQFGGMPNNWGSPQGQFDQGMGQGVGQLYNPNQMPRYGDSQNIPSMMPMQNQIGQLSQQQAIAALGQYGPIPREGLGGARAPQYQPQPMPRQQMPNPYQNFVPYKNY